MEEMTQEEIERRITITVNDYGGIIPMQEVFYLHSILYSSGSAIDAFDRYEYSLKADLPPDIVFNFIQEAIGHSAALSRYFWTSGLGSNNKSSRKLKEKRAKLLRVKFGLNEASPLKNRHLRDAWEHFDERLDNYLIANISGYFFPAPMIGSHTLADESIGKIFKLLDPEAHCIILLGQKYFFEPIKNEVVTIYNHAITAYENGGRL
ncbi:MAG: hypothetical protein HYV28_01920 [Ignavibacteriales bacterium]|nr:hypothetical protein [Ignavibacteriales bacterium]